MTTRAILYRRVSRDEQLTGFSPEAQLQDCLAYCAENGYDVVGDFLESGTATEMEARVELTHIRQLFRQQAFDVLVVWKFDRLHRNQTNQAVVAYEAKKYGVRVESVTEKVDDSPVGQLVKSVYFFKAAQEIEDMKQRTMRGTRARVDAGYPLVGARPPYGYRWCYSSVKERVRKTHLEPDEKTAPIVVRIFKLLSEGVSLSGVAVWLYDNHVPPPRGGSVRWHKSTIRSIVDNSLYWGKPVAYRSTVAERRVVDKDGDVALRKRQVPRSRDEWVALPESSAPPLVSEDIAVLVHQRLSESRSHPVSGRTIQPDSYLLRGGFAVCGICNHSLSCRRRSGRNHYYTCYFGAGSKDARHYNTIPSRLLDTAARTSVNKLVEDSSILDTALAKLELDYAHGNGGEAETIHSLLADLAEQRAGLAMSLARCKTEIERAPLEHLNTQLAQQEAEHRESLARLSDSETTYRQRRGALLKAKTMLTELDGRTLTDDELRQIMFSLSVVVVVYGASREPRYHLESRPLSRVNTISLRSGFWPVLPRMSRLPSVLVLQTNTDGCWMLSLGD